MGSRAGSREYSLRRSRAAAPLKLGHVLQAHPALRDSPPLTSGGPVEACSTTRSTRGCSATSPPLPSGGPVEAYRVAAVAAAMACALRRSRAAAPLKRLTPMDAPPASSPLRRSRAAAPLKPPALGYVEHGALGSPPLTSGGPV